MEEREREEDGSSNCVLAAIFPADIERFSSILWHGTRLERLIPHCDPNMLMLWHTELLDKQKVRDNWQQLGGKLKKIEINTFPLYILGL